MASGDFVTQRTKTYPNSAVAITLKFGRVKIDSAGAVALAGLADTTTGVVDSAYAASVPATVILMSSQGTIPMVASGVVAINALVYPAASGKVSATAIGRPLGRCQGIASTADADVIEVQPIHDAQAALPTVEAHTADDTLVAAEMNGSVHTSVGATGAITLTLPAATVGMSAFFKVGAAQELRLDPDGTETIALPSTGVQGAAGKYLTANAAGETVHLLCSTAGTWDAYGFTGTWTAEG